MQLAGVAIGSKYDHHAFMESVEHSAVVCARQLTALALAATDPVLGIPSDVP